MRSRSSVSLSGCGIMVSHGKSTISLDPPYLVDCDFVFVSHAHTDHLHRSKKGGFRGKILASHATSLIADVRGYKISNALDTEDGFELIDAGHIMGSRGLLIGSDVYYTGDISTRERAFMRPANIPKVNTLIIESTFGRPEYVFPNLDDIIHDTNEIISEAYDMGKPVVLMGYPLGKAQLLTELFGHWDPVYVHDSVAKMNSVYRELGISLKRAMPYSMTEKQNLLDKKPWLMIGPLLHARNEFVRIMKEKYGAVTVGFSGWATNKRYKFMMGLDHAMALSDHCDFNELANAVKACKPEKVCTFHGFAKDFAMYLRENGYDAEAVGESTEARQMGIKPISRKLTRITRRAKTLSLDLFS